MIHFYAIGTRALCAILIATALALSVQIRTSLGQTTPIRVVATTTILADTTSQIAGPNAIVESLMGPGVDPHLYKPSPGDLRKLSHASIVLYNGLHLEGKMIEVLETLSHRKPTIAVADGIPHHKLRRVSSGADSFDPHIWFDISLWIQAAEMIRHTLARHDPQHADGYTERFEKFRAELVTLENWCRGEISRVPQARRVLVTAHDAFGYMGRAYGIEVLGIQGISTDSEASLRDVNELVSLLVRRRVPAVFVESTISPRMVQALLEGANAQGHAVVVGGELFGDALGDPSSAAANYQGMVRHNVSTIVRSLLPKEGES